MQELIVTVKAGKILNRTDMVKMMHRLKDGDYRLQIDPYRVRSLDQNEYYWKVVVDMVFKGLVYTGHDEIKTQADAHAFLKKEFIGGDKPTTTNLTTQQFSDYVEAVCKFAAEYLSVVIPPAIKK